MPYPYPGPPVHPPVGSDQGGARFDGQGRQRGVRHQISLRPACPAECREQFPVPRTRANDDCCRGIEHRAGERQDLVEGLWHLEDPAVGGDPDHRGEHRLADADVLRSRELRLEPPPELRVVGDVVAGGTDVPVDVKDQHRSGIGTGQRVVVKEGADLPLFRQVDARLQSKSPMGVEFHQAKFQARRGSGGKGETERILDDGTE